MMESDFAESIELSLLKEYGPILSDERLANCLGYPSIGAFRKAVSRKTVPITVFSIPNRSGKFALTKDVAGWLVTQRINAMKEEKP
ncbi:MAG: hypothetical protein JKX82_12755 [Oleispira sp.]|nr:hypothetical protein [Oleispira sp.]